MNIFRLVADLMHLASIGILLLKIQKTRSCVGESYFDFEYSSGAMDNGLLNAAWMLLVLA
jgi:hypothetical protein